MVAAQASRFALDLEVMRAKCERLQWSVDDLDWEAPGAELVDDDLRGPAGRLHGRPALDRGAGRARLPGDGGDRALAGAGRHLRDLFLMRLSDLCDALHLRLDPGDPDARRDHARA
jgi:hypothetical protein